MFRILSSSGKDGDHFTVALLETSMTRYRREVLRVEHCRVFLVGFDLIFDDYDDSECNTEDIRMSTGSYFKAHVMGECGTSVLALILTSISCY